MYARILACSALAVVAATYVAVSPARAAVVYDTINTTDAAYGGTDGPGNGSMIMANSFNVPGSLDFGRVTLALQADNPNDGGSTMVYLVPDDGSGATNVAGYPIYSLDPTSSFANGFDPSSVLLGTIADSSLVGTGTTDDNGNPVVSLVSFQIPLSAFQAVSAATSNNEYWIGLISDANSSIEWVLTGDNSGVGTEGQNYYDNAVNVFGATNDPTFGLPEMTADVPEPMTLAILGGGLAGLGYMRRRTAKKA